MSKKKGAALAGGGGKIGFQAGVVYQYVKQGWYPDMIQGISAGSLVGIMLAMKKLDRLKHLMRTVEDKDVRKRRPVSKMVVRQLQYWIGRKKSYLGLWSNEPLQELLRREMLGNKVYCDYYAGAVDLENADYYNLSIPAGTVFTEEVVDSYVAMVAASTAIPIMFEPVNWGGINLWDGGLYNNAPIKPMSALMGCDHITIITMDDGIYDERDIVNYVDVGLSSIQSMLHYALESDIGNFKRMNRVLLDAGHVQEPGVHGYKYIPYNLIRPEKSLGPTEEFHHRFTSPDFDYGIQYAIEHPTPENNIPSIPY